MNTSRRWLLCRLFLLGLFVSSGRMVAAQNNLKDIPPTDPEEERKSFQVADGFEVNLYAADPLLAKPIQMNFDPQGRLWVASSEVYPQIMPGQKANDKILILEDTKGTGVADKTTIFADGLLIPTGVVPGDGGAYVANSTELLFFKDKGDGHADLSEHGKRVVLSGFGTEDTHHILHTLRWSLDGMLYMNQSIYIHSHIETPWGVRRLNGGGIWQFRPETMQLEVFAKGWVNSWGHHFNRWGSTFVTDGAGGEGINYAFPGSVFATSPGAPRIVKGLNPGSPKDCGLEIISGRHLPDDWQGNLLTNDFRAHRVCRYIVTEDGSGFVSREQKELIKTNHPAFRPIDVKMGPDGAIYIADWYNPIIQHGEVDFRDPRRDHTHGRIWRVTAKGRPAVEKPKLVGAPVPALLDALKAPEGWTRDQAKRVLKERGAKEVLPVLADWVKQLDPQVAEFEHHRLEALWTYQSLDVVNPELIATLAGSANYNVRAAVSRVIGQWQGRLPTALSLLTQLVSDENPRVRLEAVRALALIPSAKSAEVALQALDRPVDQFLDFAIWQAARDLQPQWLSAVQSGEIMFDHNVRHLAFAIQASGSKDSVPALVKVIQDGKLAPEREESLLVLLAGLGGRGELNLVFEAALKANDATARQAKLLSTLLRTARERKLLPAGDGKRLEPLLSNPEEPIRATAAELAGLWKVNSLRSKLNEMAKDSTTSDALRDAVIQGLVALGGKESVDVLAELTTGTHSVPTRRAAIVGMSNLDLDAAAKQAVVVFKETPADEGVVALVTAFLERKNGPAKLAEALKDQKLPLDIAKLGVRAVRTAARAEPDLLSSLQKAGGMTTGPKLLSEPELQQLYADIKTKGDAARGEAVFRRSDLVCLKCHAIGGAGGQVGPDLVSIGATAQLDYLVESIFEPSKKIKEGYHALTVQTTGGRVITGIKLRQTDKDLLLRDAEDREVAVPLDEVENQKDAGSLMPVGLADTLTQTELTDLVRFLSELGKIGPYSLSKSPINRRWQTPVLTAENKTKFRQDMLAPIIGYNPAIAWNSVYSKVSGELPVHDLPVINEGGIQKRVIVRCQLEVSTGGKVGFESPSAEQMNVYVDGRLVTFAAKTEIDLTPGYHTLVVLVAAESTTVPLRMEMFDVTGSPAKARWLLGK